MNEEELKKVIIDATKKLDELKAHPWWHDEYCIKSGYKVNEEDIECDLTAQEPLTTGLALQKHVYELAKEKFLECNCRHILDIGCGSGHKLIHYFGDYETLGIDIAPNYEQVKLNYPDREWEFADYKPTNRKFDMIICADVIEHLVDPDIIMQYIKDIDPRMIVLSTPSRELLPEHFRSDDGPPKNYRHIREWTTQEFIKYVGKWFNYRKDYQIEYWAQEVGVTVILKKI